MIEPLILVRALHFAATLLASGTVGFGVAVARGDMPPALRRRLAFLTWGALAAAVLSGAAWLVLLASDIFGAPIVEVCLNGGAWSVLNDTRFGQVASVRLAVAVVMAALVASPGARALQLAAAALFAALPAWTGHAGAGLGPAGTVHLWSDAVHLLAAAAWLGALPALALFLRMERRAEALAAVTGRFSRLGVASVAVLLASGLINSWNLLGDPRNLIATDYGRLLLLKIALFVAMVAVAAVNRFHLTPRLPDGGAAGALARNSLREAALGLGVVLFVGALGTVPPSAHVHVAPTAIPTEAAYVHIHTAEAMADVIVDPGATQNRAIIRLSRDDGQEYPARRVRLVLDPPSGGQSLQIDANRNAEGAWEAAGLTLPAPGTWTVKVVIGTEAGGELILDAPIMIEP